MFATTCASYGTRISKCPRFQKLEEDTKIFTYMPHLRLLLHLDSFSFCDSIGDVPTTYLVLCLVFTKNLFLLGILLFVDAPFQSRKLGSVYNPM